MSFAPSQEAFLPVGHEMNGDAAAKKEKKERKKKDKRDKKDRKRKDGKKKKSSSKQSGRLSESEKKKRRARRKRRGASRGRSDSSSGSTSRSGSRSRSSSRSSRSSDSGSDSASSSSEGGVSEFNPSGARVMDQYGNYTDNAYPMQQQFPQQQQQQMQMQPYDDRMGYGPDGQMAPYEGQGQVMEPERPSAETLGPFIGDAARKHIDELRRDNIHAQQVTLSLTFDTRDIINTANQLRAGNDVFNDRTLGSLPDALQNGALRVFPTVVSCTNKAHGEYLAARLERRSGSSRSVTPFKCHVLNTSVSNASNDTGVNLALELEGIEAHGAPAYPNSNARVLIPAGQSKKGYSHARTLDPSVLEFQVETKSGDVIGVLNECAAKRKAGTIALHHKKDKAALNIIHALAAGAGIDISGSNAGLGLMVTPSSHVFSKGLWKEFYGMAKDYFRGTTPPVDLTEVNFRLIPTGNLPRSEREAHGDVAPGLSSWMIRASDLLEGTTKPGKVCAFIVINYVPTSTGDL